MPRVMVTTDQTEQGDAAVLLDEQVHMVHLSSDHSAMQFIERLGWAISDAEDSERNQVPRQARRHTTGARPSARRRPRARNSVHA